MRRKVRVRIIDKRTPRASQLATLSTKREGFEVGVFEPTLSKIASYHEFGTTTIPRRSFLRAWYAENLDAIKERLRLAFVDLYNGDDPTHAVEQMGKWAVNGIRIRILNKIPPKLAPATIRQKDGVFKYTPLIDRGRLFRAIEFRTLDRHADDTEKP